VLEAGGRGGGGREGGREGPGWDARPRGSVGRGGGAVAVREEMARTEGDSGRPKVKERERKFKERCCLSYYPLSLLLPPPSLPPSLPPFLRGGTCIALGACRGSCREDEDVREGGGEGGGAEGGAEGVDAGVRGK
jgi:hypothetical protein